LASSTTERAQRLAPEHKKRERHYREGLPAPELKKVDQEATYGKEKEGDIATLLDSQERRKMPPLGDRETKRNCQQASVVTEVLLRGKGSRPAQSGMEKRVYSTART